jgi:hypothetical protein
MGRDRPLSALVPVALAVLALATLLVVIPVAPRASLRAPAGRHRAAAAPDDAFPRGDPRVRRPGARRPNRIVARPRQSERAGRHRRGAARPNAMTEAETLKKAGADSAGWRPTRRRRWARRRSAFYQQAGGRPAFGSSRPCRARSTCPPRCARARRRRIVTGIGETPDPSESDRKGTHPADRRHRRVSSGTLEAAEAAAHASCEILVALAPDSPAASQGKAVPLRERLPPVGGRRGSPLVRFVPGRHAPHPLAPGPRTVVAQWASPERDTRLALRRRSGSRVGPAAPRWWSAPTIRLLPRSSHSWPTRPHVRPVLASEAPAPPR